MSESEKSAFSMLHKGTNKTKNLIATAVKYFKKDHKPDIYCKGY